MAASSVSKSQVGFSLVELLLAMALFSFALLVIAIGFLSLFRMYQAGIADRHTQLGNRQALDDLIQVSRGGDWFGYNSSPLIATGRNDLLCIAGATNKIYFLDTVTHHQLIRADWNPNGVCNISNAANLVYITPTDVQVSSFAIEPIADPGSLIPCGVAPCHQYEEVRVSLSVTNDIGDLDNSGMPTVPAQNCKGTSSRQACSITTLSSTVSARGFAP